MAVAMANSNHRLTPPNPSWKYLISRLSSSFLIVILHPSNHPTEFPQPSPLGTLYHMAVPDVKRVCELLRSPRAQADIVKNYSVDMSLQPTNQPLTHATSKQVFSLNIAFNHIQSTLRDALKTWDGNYDTVILQTLLPIIADDLAKFVADRTATSDIVLCIVKSIGFLLPRSGVRFTGVCVC
jgi:hypothetical protein